VNDTALSRGRLERFRGASTLGCWFRSDRGKTIVTGVSQWDDYSGNAFHVVQAVEAEQPTVVAAAYNGRPGVRFTSAANQMLLRVNTNIIGTGAYTIIWAGKIRASAGAEGLFGNMKAAAGVGLYNDTGPVRSVFAPGVAVMTDGSVQTTSAEIQIATRAAGAAPSLSINGVDQGALTGASSSMGDVSATGSLVVGANWLGAISAPSDSDAIECAIFNRVTNTSETARILKYVGAQAGIATA